MRRILTTTSALLAGVAALGAVGQANAGGFSRGTADTAIIYEEGNFNMRHGVTIVAPQRDYETIDTNGALFPGGSAAGTDDVYSDDYIIPSYAVKFAIGDSASCAGTYTTPFGSGASYGEQAIAAGAAGDGTGTISEGFDSREFGLTCGYNFAFENGHRLWFLGGVFGQDFEYEQTVRYNGTVLAAGVQRSLLADGVDPAIAAAQAAALGGALNGTQSTLTFDGDYELGYRGGIAYEIPQIAFRAELLYRSEVNHTPSGSFTALGGAAPTIGDGTLPRSIELRLQSGIAANTLAFANVKWTDWSVLDTLDYTIQGGPLAGDRVLEYFWQDGWTITGGVGRQFTDSISGLVSLTWDRGVATTEDAFFDTYTLALGGSLTDQWGGQLRAGLGLSYLEGGDVSGTPFGAGAGNSFAYTVDGDYSVAGSLSYSIRW